jgi:hypothetical protein
MFTARFINLRTIGLVVAATATGLLAGAPAQAVSAGSEAVGAGYGFAAKIQIGSDTGVACSGALVSTRWVITSKSCFGATVTAGIPAQPTTVTVGRPDLNQASGHVLPATELIPHPDRDVVLVRLAAEVTGVKPVALATAAPAVGDQLTLAGFGRTANEWVPDKLRAAPFTVDAVGTTSLDVHAESGASTCKGDQGGPALTGSGDQFKLVALHAASWQKGCFDSKSTRDGATETRVDGVGTWITQQISPRGPNDNLRNNQTRLCMAIEGAVKTAGAKTLQWPCVDNVDHRFVQRAADDTFIELVNANSNLCVSVGTSTTSGGPATQAACATPGAQWTPILLPGALVQYRNRLSGLCLAVPGASTTAGTQLIQFACNSANGQPRADQVWKATSNDLGRHLRSNLTNQCVAMGSSTTANGAGAIQYTCNDNNDQRWSLEKQADGKVWIRNLNSKKCLTVSGSTVNAAPVQQWPCAANSDQMWAVEQLTVGGKAVIRFRNAFSNQCMGVKGGSTTVATPIVQWPCNGNPDHNFIL